MYAEVVESLVSAQQLTLQALADVIQRLADAKSDKCLARNWLWD